MSPSDAHSGRIPSLPHPGPVRPIVFSDFDGTITQVDVTDWVLSQLAHPAWQEIEQEWVRGTIGSRECMERQIELVEASSQELDDLVDRVPMDPHFAEFCRFAEQHDIPIIVLSDSFDYFIRRVLARVGVSWNVKKGIRVFSSTLVIEDRKWVPSFPHPPETCPHGCATCKPGLIRQLSDGHAPIVFVGDGLSDRFVLEEADLVFAKRQFLAYCREHDRECVAFETFAEVEGVLRSMLQAAVV